MCRKEVRNFPRMRCDGAPSAAVAYARDELEAPDMPGRNPFRGKGLHNGIEDGIPDGTTLWLFRETLAKAGLIEKLFEGFGQHLEAKGYIARGGQMVDTTIVPVPKQRNSRDENDDVKVGKTPEAWEKSPAKNRQKDKDARWTKKHGKSFYGYKNHVNADAKHKLIRQSALYLDGVGAGHT